MKIVMMAAVTALLAAPAMAGGTVTGVDAAT